MKKISLLLTLIFLCIFSCFGAYKIAYFVTEKFFFDKVFLGKSAVHGYTKDYSEIITHHDNPDIIEKRVKDLRALANNFSTSQNVLGLSTESKFKVAIIGDSMTYGIGVTAEQAYPSLLERKLNSIQPTKVYMLAEPGDDLLDNYSKYELAETQIKPDLYILTLVDNDLLFNPLDRYPNKQAIFDSIKPECPKELFSYEWPNDFTNNVWDYLVNELYYPSFSDEYANICFLDQISKKINYNKTLLFSLTFLSEETEITTDRTQTDISEFEMMKKYYSYFRDKNATIITPASIPDFNYSTVSPQEGHPSVATHKQYADILFKEITRNPQWGF